MAESPLVLALDTGSPIVSVALGRGGEVLAARAIEQARSSATLLDQVAAVLAEIGARPADLGAVVALRGPGSFTGLRIGLSTALGLHQALGVRATALPTLRALATWAAGAAGEAGEGPVLAVVDALRGEWSAQLFSADPFPRALSAEELRPGTELAGRIAGFGVSRLAADARGLLLLEPGPLAPAAIRLAAEPDLAWDPSLLTSPLYARPPAVTVPKGRA
ncbi:MAG TPA: tRNA (adenosine(37)-N6)-threonylcarbamoyltransferase complex dimerization subunit type 1 TsaB [Thermoanaerobaculia bacterium]|nr:tRNA (adenosine(37)-N6)-threonylcarbamoyltransferase complex dimerization subunit type 1 TsaB [Thermoanaerobaculia bacterium]